MKPFPKEITIGDKYGPAMKIENQAEADEYLEACIVHNMLFGTSREEAKAIELQNLGYYAGYYGPETRQRVHRLFGAVHPIFGNNFNPEPDKALISGMRMAAGLTPVRGGNADGV